MKTKSAGDFFEFTNVWAVGRDTDREMSITPGLYCSTMRHKKHTKIFLS